MTSQNSINNNRLLPIEGAYNVRDLGGYATTDNKTVKKEIVFRSGDLNLLTDDDLNYLSNIPLITTIDFRTPAEIEAAPDRKPASLKNQYFFPIDTGSIINFKNMTKEMLPELLVLGNESFVNDCQPLFRQFFEVLMSSQNAPLLLHCSAGKDRAGFASALFLSSLGVDRETIIQDYLLTNEYLQDKYESLITSMPILTPLLEAKREYIEAAFNEIDKNYGGIEKYLTDNLDVNLNTMKDLYTQ